MRVFLSLLLVAISCVEFVQTLQCYSCPELTAVEHCVTIRNCTGSENMCKTTMYSLEDVYPFMGVLTVTKMCASECVPSDVDGIGQTRPVSCCYTDLCNSNGAAGLKINFVSVGVLASSLCAFFWTRP
ncbi:ly6/PLAUR domain-containing protein 2 [Patagioenas fasciata monilis]|uniref:Ly6/PLAUR domain-containing protein 2 n=1 Tax=Patagioenas fasciata monilis TaxID=372326 RepID=A0A1V4JVN7_PATFA|nr:ly6/PLAUR domain-containing protein 2 [Patagioenas fasciata monilis]